MGEGTIYVPKPRKKGKAEPRFNTCDMNSLKRKGEMVSGEQSQSKNKVTHLSFKGSISWIL